MHSGQAEGGILEGLWLCFLLPKFHTCLEAQCEPSKDPWTMAGSSQVSLLEVSSSVPLPGLVLSYRRCTAHQHWACSAEH